MWTSWWLTKVIRIHPLGTMNVCTKFHCPSANSCWDISVWIRVVAYRSLTWDVSLSRVHSVMLEVFLRRHICRWLSELMIDSFCLPSGPMNSWWLSCQSTATWTSSNLTAETTHGKRESLSLSVSLYHSFSLSLFLLFLYVFLFLWWWSFIFRE